MTCDGEMVKNANCPKNQYMVVKIASFRGLLPPKKCSLSDDYSCEVDVTCLVKKKCDGLNECTFTVDDSFFSGDVCPGLSNYLYFEYQCIDAVKTYKGPCGMYRKSSRLTLLRLLDLQFLNTLPTISVIEPAMRERISPITKI